MFAKILDLFKNRSAFHLAVNECLLWFSLHTGISSRANQLRQYAGQTKIRATWHSFSRTHHLITKPKVVPSTIHFPEIDSIRSRNVILILLGLALGLAGCSQMPGIDSMALTPRHPTPDCGTPDCSSAAIVRSMPKPVFRPQGLPVPIFSPQGGAMPYGEPVKLTVANLPPGAVFEYSYDNGKTWAVGDRALVIGRDEMLARTRINDLTSNPARARFVPYFQRMMVVGNSIMSHGPAPEIGWYNFNGMAASAPDKDYVHLLTTRLAFLNPKVQVKLQSGGNFERDFGKAAYSLDEFNGPLQDFGPDLIVVRLGENVEEGEVLGTRNFALQFQRLLERFTRSGRPVRIVCTTSVWNRPQTDAIIRKITTEKGYPLVDLSSMVGRSLYFASQYKDPGVSAHPNDAGMQRIADLIWEKVP